MLQKLFGPILKVPKWVKNSHYKLMHQTQNLELSLVLRASQWYSPSSCLCRQETWSVFLTKLKTSDWSQTAILAKHYEESQPSTHQMGYLLPTIHYMISPTIHYDVWQCLGANDVVADALSWGTPELKKGYCYVALTLPLSMISIKEKCLTQNTTLWQYHRCSKI